MPLNVVGRRKMLWVRSTITCTDSLSTTGAWIGAASASSTQIKPLAAAALANAAVLLRKSRRPIFPVIVASLGLADRKVRSVPPAYHDRSWRRGTTLCMFRRPRGDDALSLSLRDRDMMLPRAQGDCHMADDGKQRSDLDAPAGISSELSRRGFVASATAAAAGGIALAHGPANAAIAQADVAGLPPYGNGTLPPDIRSRMIAGVNGMTVHILEAGFETPGRPAMLLLDGFPELAYSWRKVMRPLADAGYHVIAPDQRGYGRTAGWDDSYDADPDQFRLLNMVRDAMGLVLALGYREVAAVVGHDAGSPVAAGSAVIRPAVLHA